MSDVSPAPGSASPPSPSPSPATTHSDDLGLLLDVMPPRLRTALDGVAGRELLIELILDLGRLPEARFHDTAPERLLELSSDPVSAEDLAYVVERVGSFGGDNRAGIGGTLHRISAIRNRVGDVIGLTCRVGRAVFGTVDVLRDVIEAGSSALLLGRPGVGKTTLLREAARVLADDLGKRVVIVDTSNEIAGDGDVPHPGIGRARRMQVPKPSQQHAVMIEAVENHMPEVVVIDEIGTEAEALAARTIAERGVQLIATAHGNTLENLLRNPTLSDLVGGIQAVILSDEEARRRDTQKTVLERKAPPTFDVVVEIQEKDRLAIHHRVAEVVDRFLRGVPPRPEVRVRTADGEVEIHESPPAPPGRGRRAAVTGRGREEGRRAGGGARGEPRREPTGFAVGQDRLRPEGESPAPRATRRRLRIYPYAVGRDKVDRAIRQLKAPAVRVEKLPEADVVLTLKSQAKRQPQRLRDAGSQGKRIEILRSNTVGQIENFLRQELSLGVPGGDELYAPALREVEDAIDQVLDAGHPVELSPQPADVRRLQHEAVHQAGLTSRSHGPAPYRRVVVYAG